MSRLVFRGRLKAGQQPLKLPILVRFQAPEHRAELVINQLRISYMEAPKLFVAYLGGKMSAGRIGEDHETVLVVASNIQEAKIRARAKWKGIGAAHLDMLTEVSVIDGYRIELSQVPQQEQLGHIDDWGDLNADSPVS